MILLQRLTQNFKNTKTMITLLAKRIGTGVNLYDKENNLKAIFPRRGYRPTKATKEVMVNCWKYKLEWI